ncbi:DUF1636 domain-containing protein [Aureimonas fodinaquatilis]|uniref:DUF1636 domain-containing protein n=1 Tax=Aureimonas fodinaquatilis TaxID=2565783 RepID=A0A5B0DUT7_9HYPH|nr:DUF1636 domain-containing protein [Aureimonas fodinaquatilis]KAA0969551.1 DUF1636 domain-containing protein [Aureimonas fodinaquatilis]
MSGVTLYVCTTCSRSNPRYGDSPRAGKILHERLSEEQLPEGVALVGVECLSACSRSCSVALTAPGRWTYVYGDLDPDIHVAAILDGAARYSATDDGLVPWRERPEIFRKQSVARIPPQES